MVIKALNLLLLSNALGVAGDLSVWVIFSVCISCDVIWTSRSRLLELLDCDCKSIVVGWLGLRVLEDVRYSLCGV